MSIFLSNKAKENAKVFWYGLLFPIVVGFGTTLVSIFVFIRFETSIADDSFVEYFLLSMYGLGVMVIWPLFAYRLFSRAKMLGKESLRKGASILKYLDSMVILTNYRINAPICRLKRTEFGQVNTSSKRSCSAAIRSSMAIRRPLLIGFRQRAFPYGCPTLTWTLVPPPRRGATS